jgi:hypothetical protein
MDLCRRVGRVLGPFPKKPSAGIRQRFDLNASLKEPDVSTVSARALLGAAVK